MIQTTHIAAKEFKDYFISPIAYIVISLFLVITGWFFFSTFFIYDRADMRGFFSLLPLIFSFVIPAVTMRLFSEEMNVGSYETLLTMPVTFADIAVGKFLAALAFTGAMLLPTLFYHLFQSIAKGVIDSRDLLYFLSVMVLGLFGTYLVMQEKN